MDMLRVKGHRVVDAQDKPIALRGTCVGGWMNMENFINGNPGAEHSLRATMAEIIGPAKAEFFFERLLDHFLSEDDIAFMKLCGATVVRLPSTTATSSTTALLSTTSSKASSAWTRRSVGAPDTDCMRSLTCTPSRAGRTRTGTVTTAIATAYSGHSPTSRTGLLPCGRVRAALYGQRRPSPATTS